MVTSHSVYQIIQCLYTQHHKTQLECRREQKWFLTLSIPLPWWLPPGTAPTSACRFLHSATKNIMLSSKNERHLRSYPIKDIYNSIINNHFQQQKACSVQRTQKKCLKVYLQENTSRLQHIQRGYGCPISEGIQGRSDGALGSLI